MDRQYGGPFFLRGFARRTACVDSADLLDDLRRLPDENESSVASPAPSRAAAE